MAGNTIYPNPDILGLDRLSNSTFLRISPKKVDEINVNARLKSLTSRPTGDVYYFILPDEISIPLQHSWREHSTVSGNIRQLHATIKKQLGEGESVIAAGGKAIGEVGAAMGSLAKGQVGAAGGHLVSSLEKLEGNVKPIGIGDFALKNDNPVVYDNSTRRNLSVELSLAVYTDTYKDVMFPIEKLMELSSPTRSNSSSQQVGFTYPHIFDISIVLGVTSKSTMYHIPNAAITSINPTLKYPYINGYPSAADITLQFEDLDPLYTENLVEGKKVSVSRKRGQ